MKAFDRLDNYINDKKPKVIYCNNTFDIVIYDEIVDFSYNKIVIRYQNHVLNVLGDNLVIAKMQDDEVLITGTIDNVSF